MTTELLDTVVSSNSQALSNASSAIKLFENPLFKIRVIMRCAEPWFVAKDACDCLEIADASQACKNLDDDEKQVVARSPELSLLFTESSNAPTMTLIFGQKHNGIECALCPTAKRACDRAWVSAKNVEVWSKMSKKTLWRWLGKLEKARRIQSFSDMKKIKIDTNREPQTHGL